MKLKAKYIKTKSNFEITFRAFIDEYESRYGALTLEDPSCGRIIRGNYYAWEIAPDLLGCGSTIELTDTHVTFVNSLSTGSTSSNQIEGILLFKLYFSPFKSGNLNSNIENSKIFSIMRKHQLF